MPRTRILLVDMVQMFREILTSILLPHPALELITTAAGAVEQIDKMVERHQVDVVIVSTQEPGFHALLARLLDGRPCPRVFVIARDGRETVPGEPLGELSPAGLLDAVQRPFPRPFPRR
ncbi:MAG: hypothetical protein AB7V44_34870 [Pseudonocardia sp.]